uniref:MADF domain-containing protein n=1 Tax=Glossina brevipalpis TaxID=37001 RepID=A0A1A9WM04_9MUSC
MNFNPAILRSNLMHAKIMEWTNDDALELIEQYRSHTELWNRADPKYKDKLCRFRAWSEIAERFGCSKAEVERKMNVLLTQYRREKHKIYESSSAAAASTVPTTSHHRRMKSKEMKYFGAYHPPIVNSKVNSSPIVDSKAVSTLISIHCFLGLTISLLLNSRQTGQALSCNYFPLSKDVSSEKIVHSNLEKWIFSLVLSKYQHCNRKIALQRDNIEWEDYVICASDSFSRIGSVASIVSSPLSSQRISLK